MQRKQQWYQTNQINMSREDEQEYLEYCADSMFRIHILELRLNRYYFFFLIFKFNIVGVGLEQKRFKLF
jgi:hypothetical protein